MDEGGGEVEPLLHASRVESRPLVRDVLEFNKLQQFVDPLLESRSPHLLKIALELEVLPPRQVSVHNGLLALGADEFADLLRVLVQVVAGHGNPARRLSQEGREHLDGGTLSRSVRSQESEEFPFTDTEGYTLDSLRPVAVNLHKVVNRDDVGQTAQGLPRGVA